MRLVFNAFRCHQHILARCVNEFEKVNPYESPRDAGPASLPPVTRKQPSVSWFAVILIGLAVPGLAYWLVTRTERALLVFLAFLVAIPMSFLFFGPVWDMLIFAGTPYSQSGVYPFLGSLVLVPLLSLLLAVRAKWRLERTY